MAASPPLLRRPSGATLAALVALGALPGCGPSPQKVAYRDYVARVEPFLQQDADRWNRLAALSQERRDDPALPRYYAFLRDTALPFYSALQDTVREAAPADPVLAGAQASLVRFAEARLEFVNAELAAEDVNRRGSQDGGLVAIMSGLEEAENLRYEYMEAVADDVPDAKLSKLYEIVDGFSRNYFRPMQEGVRDPADVQAHLRATVIPQLQDLRQQKYADDAPTRLLKDCVVAWLHWHEHLAEVCPLLMDVLAAKQRSQAAANAGEKSLQEFQAALRDVKKDL